MNAPAEAADPPTRGVRAEAEAEQAEARTALPVREVLVPWLVSRAYAIAVIALASRLSPRTHNITTQGFANWDADWYVRIAREGYGYTAGGYSSYPFFPLMPAILRAGRAVGLPYALTGVIVSNVAFLVALWGIHRIATRHAGPRAAAVAVWAAALFPAAAIFSTPYPSAIFLAGSVWAFLMVEDNRDAEAAGLAAIATLIRPNGVTVVVVLVVAVLMRDGVRSWWRAALIAAPSVLALGAWMATLQRWTGDALIFVTAKSAWEEITLLDVVTGRAVKPSAFAHLAVAAVAITALVLARRKIPLSWHLFALLYLAPPLVLGVVGLARYSNECFPLPIAVGIVAAGIPTRLRTAGYLASAAGLAVLGGTAAAGRVVP